MVLGVSFSAAFMPLTWSEEHQQLFMYAAMFVWTLPAMYFTWLFVVQRVHDIDFGFFAGTLIFLIELIPALLAVVEVIDERIPILIMVCIWLMLSIFPGDSRPNDYGPPNGDAEQRHYFYIASPYILAGLAWAYFSLFSR
jgi:uncharacterized membrane protein YhaH (DUF805 family)